MAEHAALGRSGYVGGADPNECGGLGAWRCPRDATNAVLNRLGMRIPVFGTGQPGNYALDHKFLLAEFGPSWMTVAVLNAAGGIPAFVSPSQAPIFQTYPLQSLQPSARN